MPENFRQILTDDISRINTLIDRVLPNPNQQKIVEAMRYSLLSGGKRVRGCLVYATAKALNTANSDLDRIACAIETIHCFSLIHDDLPAMDDDDIRRNQPSNHKKFDEATAILSGDALQTFAYEIINSTQLLDIFPSPCQNTAQLSSILSTACGMNGMILGQMIDLKLQGVRHVTIPELETLHAHKTGKLFSACTQMAAIACNVTDTFLLTTLAEIAQSFGLAFQIRDDILDVIKTKHTTRPTGSDQKNNKATFVSILGIDQARIQLREQIEILTTKMDTLANHPAIEKMHTDYMRWLMNHILQID